MSSISFEWLDLSELPMFSALIIILAMMDINSDSLTSEDMVSEGVTRESQVTKHENHCLSEGI